jgi:DNA-directed RNA polymerase subunit M/transcription elongation factor TFIIS
MRCYFDIETSPNIVASFQIGYNVRLSHYNIIQERKIICICWKFEGEKKVHSLTWDKNQDDKTMLIQFAEATKRATEMVAHNGDRYDIKWINTRLLFHELPPIEYNTLDTLKKVRSTFYLNSNKLDYLGRYLNLGKKLDHTGLQLWLDVMEGKQRALNNMVKYCKQDVKLLESVFNRIKPYIKQNQHQGRANGYEKWTCPSCASHDVVKWQNRTTAAGTVKHRMKCKNCKHTYTISNMDFLKYNEQKVYV